MNATVLNTICCPKCGGDLTAIKKENLDGDILEGSLVCVVCRSSFKISEGVPTLIWDLGDRKRMADGWGYEWTKKEEGRLETNTSYGKSEEKEVADFFSHLGIEPDDIRNKSVLDAGCGFGRLTNALGRYAGEVYGIDIATSIRNVAKRRRYPNVHIVEGDIHSPPFKRNSFDYVWSNLAICYLHDPRAAFRNLAAITRHSGRLYVSLPDKSALAFPVKIRDAVGVFHMLPIPWVFYASWFFGFFLFVAKRLARRRNKTSLRTNVFFVFTVLHPKIMTRHNRDEVIGWFHDNGFKDVVCTSDAHTLYARGQKAGEVA